MEDVAGKPVFDTVTAEDDEDPVFSHPFAVYREAIAFAFAGFGVPATPASRARTVLPFDAAAVHFRVVGPPRTTGIAPSVSAAFFRSPGFLAPARLMIH